MPFSLFVTSRIALGGSSFPSFISLILFSFTFSGLLKSKPRLIEHLKPSARVPKGIHLSTWHLELSRSVAFSSIVLIPLCWPNDSILIPFLFIFLDRSQYSLHYRASGSCNTHIDVFENFAK